MMDNIGNTFSTKTISDFLKNQVRRLSIDTVYNYLKALENAFLIHKVRKILPIRFRNTTCSFRISKQ